MTVRVICALALLSVPAFSYVRISTPDGRPVSRPAGVAVKFRTYGTARGGLRNIAGKLILTEGSDVPAALQAAIDTWNSVEGSALKLPPLEVGDGPQQAGENLITFEDTEDNRSIVGDLVAVTRTRFYAPTGEITDARIVFNPARTFSSRLALDAMDLQSVATHEIGHALGAAHSHIRSATMYPSTGPENPNPRMLSPDDIAFLLEAYPTGESRARTGTVRGRLTCGTDACPGRATITLIEPATGTVLGAIPAGDGKYVVNGVPPGQYIAWAAPYRGDAPAAGDPIPEWRGGFAGGGQAPVAVSVSSSAVTEVDIAGSPGAPPFRLDFFACESMTWLEVLVSGRTWTCTVTGTGFGPEVSPSDLLVFGPGLAVRPDSLRFRRRGETTDLFFMIEAADRERRTYAAIGLQQGDALALLPGVMVLPRRPVLAPANLVNGASAKPGPVAPGEVVALVGSGLTAPEVLFDDITAPVLSPGEALAVVQVPFEIAGRERTILRVRSGDLETDALQVDVVSASPGLLRTIANSDGRANSTQNPAVRGSRIEVRGTGQGVLDAPLGTGERTPLPFPLKDVTATLEGVSAAVTTAEMVPGQFGLFRIVLEIPPNGPTGDAVALKITMRERSDEIPVAIR